LDLIVDRKTTIAYNPNNLCEFNGMLYFNARQSNSLPFQLMYYNANGTLTTTFDDAYIEPPTSLGTIMSPLGLTVFNDKLYFQGNANGGTELWSCDKNNHLTRVADINSTGNSDPTNFMVFTDPTDGNSSKLYFQANDGATGNELYSCSTDNTVTRLTDINAGSADSNPSYLTSYLGKLYFAATGSDGTKLYNYTATSGAVRTKDKDNAALANDNPKNLMTFNNILYFQSSHPIINTGSELWYYNAADTNYNYFTDINPSGGSDPSFITLYNNDLYFSATAGNSNYQLFCYNGSGSLPIVINLSTTSSPQFLTAFNDKLILQANGGSGNELWIYDNFYGNPVQIDLNPGTNSSNPNNFVTYNGSLYFSADCGNGDGYQIYAMYFNMPQ